VLCVWAFFAELRLAAVQRTFDERVGFDFRFCSVFGDTQRKIVTAWSAKGGYDGFADHVQHAAQQFPDDSIPISGEMFGPLRRYRRIFILRLFS
jgi:hypothetical protein